MRKKIILPVFVALLAISLAFYKFEVFTIKKLLIKTNNIACAHEAQIKESSGILGKNFFLINDSAIEINLKKEFSCIKSASVKKTIPDKVILEIWGREPLAVLAQLKSEASLSATPSALEVKDYFVFDDEAVVFSKGNFDLNLQKIYIWGQNIALGNKLEKFADVIKIIQKIKILGLEIKSSMIKDDLFIIDSSLPVSRIFFRLNDNIDIQLASLQLIADKAKINAEELEFIDLRFDKPIVKFAPKKK